MLKQQHSGSNSPMGSGTLLGSLAQHGTDANQLQMHSQATGQPSTHTCLPADKPDVHHTAIGWERNGTCVCD